ncbi:MAG: winged helix-turn-helix domain-containing protein [Woeseiaceae bacterium]|nr:winged helix-turn-helix domain-containing protein [Woeseiaceae bacterium]
MATGSGRTNPFTVGDWQVEPELDRITRGSESTYLRSQVMDLLVFLARNQGRVISLDDLLNNLWAGKVVSDGTVYNSVAELRNALTTGVDSDAYIETIPKKGYRLVAPVTGLDRDTAVSGQKRQSKQIFVAAAALTLAIIVGAWLTIHRIPEKSIAVLPFEDLSADGDQRYLGDGIAEELLNVLVRLDGLEVAGRTSSFSFRGSDHTLKSIGKQLRVANILEGSVRRDGDQLRITAQLNNAQTGYHLWSETYERQMDDIFIIQDDIARSVAGALSIALDIDGRDYLPGTGTDNVEAYDLFLKGRSADSFDSAKGYFDQAIQLDPDYAEAYAELGAAYGEKLSWQLPPKAARKAQITGRDLVRHAIDLDPDLAIAYSRLSQYAWVLGDWIAATELFREYSELAPADIAARLGSNNTLGRAGRTAEAIRAGEIRVLTDPLNVNAHLILGEHYIHAGRYDDAETVLAEADRIYQGETQGAALRRLFMAISQGEPEGIREALKNYATVDSRVDTVVDAILDVFDADTEVVLAELRRMYDDESGMTGEGRMIVASMAAHHGDAEFALGIMTEELEANLLRSGRLWYPFFSDMRRLPGFKSLARNVGFVPYWREYDWADTCESLGEEDFQCH